LGSAAQQNYYGNLTRIKTYGQSKTRGSRKEPARCLAFGELRPVTMLVMVVPVANLVLVVVMRVGKRSRGCAAKNGKRKTRRNDELRHWNLSWMDMPRSSGLSRRNDCAPQLCRQHVRRVRF
jgi:hypothetical protein